MELVPKEIEKYLVKDEIIEKRFNLRGCTVYASNKRLLMLIKKGNVVRDFDYSHISSIEYKKERQFVLILGGIFFIILAIGGTQFSDILDINWSGSLVWVLTLLGVIMLIRGLVPIEKVELAIVGLTYPLKLPPGEKSELDSLFKLIREKRI